MRDRDLGCWVSVSEINKDLDENILNYNAINGCIRYFGKKRRPEVQMKLHNIISKPTIKYGSETWVLRAEDRRRLEGRKSDEILTTTVWNYIKSQI